MPLGPDAGRIGIPRRRSHGPSGCKGRTCTRRPALRMKNSVPTRCVASGAIRDASPGGDGLVGGQCSAVRANVAGGVRGRGAAPRRVRHQSPQRSTRAIAKVKITALNTNASTWWTISRRLACVVVVVTSVVPNVVPTDSAR
jgi:hypothetical protein